MKFYLNLNNRENFVLFLKHTAIPDIKIVIGLFASNYLNLNEEEVFQKIDVSPDVLKAFYEKQENEILLAFKKMEYKKVLQLITNKIREFTTAVCKGVELHKVFNEMSRFTFILRGIHIKKMINSE